MNQESKKIVIVKKDGTTGKRPKQPSGDWNTWTPQQRADAMQRACPRFNHMAKYGRYGY